MKTNLLLVFLALASMVSCTKDTEDAAGISDVSLSSMATSQDGFTLMRTTAGEANETWKIKMNDVAAKAYADGIRNFPTNSMIVKEKHDGNGAISGYDVMFRTGSHMSSDNGWVMSSFNASGDAIYNDGERVSNCQNCHRQKQITTIY